MSYPFPPRQMRAPVAAYYVGLSESTFLERVKRGEYSAGAMDGGARVWLRDDLDRAIERRFGVVAGGADDGDKSGSWSRFSKAG